MASKEDIFTYIRALESDYKRELSKGRAVDNSRIVFDVPHHIATKMRYMNQHWSNEYKASLSRYICDNIESTWKYNEF